MPNDEIRNKKRILHLVPSWEHVGVVRRIGTLAARLDERLYEQQIVALDDKGPDPRSIARTPRPCMALATGPRLRVALAWRFRRLVRNSQIDVVHTWSRGVGRIARAALLGLHGVRLIQANPADFPAGIDVARLQNEIGEGIPRPQIIKELGLPEGALLMGTASRLTREKQVIELLWALDQIRCVRDDVYLLVIGDGDARPLFERYARLYEIGSHVRFLGWRCDAAALIARLDVYCTASLQSYCSLAVLEAMALGVPVVAAETPAHRTVIANGESGSLVNIGQRSEMARWCLRLLEDQELARRMSAAAKERAIEQFGVAQFVEQSLKLYTAGFPA
ncbi:MAG TPA: glycosyltransferase family 4 protein [Pirellulales bacterium]|nr:glycosyltransferase family 4 protein [Pirellulales bacterium]